jgi:SAM-dependent methyltransferase
MKLTNMVSGSFVPKLIGSYEQELHEVIAEIIAQSPPFIIDVGCGEGYYLIGLTLRLPRAIGIGFDISEAAQAACVQNALLNNIASQVRVNGRCDHATLNDLQLEDAIAIFDCEGFELELLDPQLVPKLRRCRILVELHEALAAGVTREILNRFASTHSVQLIDSKPRDFTSYSLLEDLSPQRASLVIDESRGGPMQWAWMQPNIAAERHNA